MSRKERKLNLEGSQNREENKKTNDASDPETEMYNLTGIDRGYRLLLSLFF